MTKRCVECGRFFKSARKRGRAVCCSDQCSYQRNRRLNRIRIRRWGAKNPEAARALKNEIAKRFYRKHRDEILERKRNDPIKKAQGKEACRRYYQRHKEAIKERARKDGRARRNNKKWYYRDIERTREINRAKAKRLRELNRRHLAAASRRWARNNPDKVRQKTENYYNPPNPKGEKQWLRKNRAQLRSVKRLLKRLSQGLPPLPNSGFTTPTDSHR